MDAPLLVADPTFGPAQTSWNSLAAFEKAVSSDNLDEIERSAHAIAIDQGENVRVFEIRIDGAELLDGIVDSSRDSIEYGVAGPVGDDILDLLNLKEERELAAPINTAVGCLPGSLLLLGEALAPEILSLELGDDEMLRDFAVHRAA